jgi:hypothetical protein
MNNFREIEDLLLIAVRSLSSIPPLMKDLDDLGTSENRKIIGTAINNLMEIQEKVYELAPLLRPKHRELYDKDEATYEQLVELATKSFQYEGSGDFIDAATCFKELLEKSDIDYFQQIAQAGLYRTTSSA